MESLGKKPKESNRKKNITMFGSQSENSIHENLVKLKCWRAKNQALNYVVKCALSYDANEVWIIIL